MFLIYFDKYICLNFNKIISNLPNLLKKRETLCNTTESNTNHLDRNKMWKSKAWQLIPMFLRLKFKIQILYWDQACSKMVQIFKEKKVQIIRASCKQQILITNKFETYLDNKLRTEMQGLRQRCPSKKILMKTFHRSPKTKMFQMQYNCKKRSKKL